MSELMSLQKGSATKYIDADKAKNGIMAFVNECGEIIGMFITDFNILLEQSAADAVEVKHGKWITKGQDIFCSVCGEESAYTWWGASKFSNYCPNCGAKMDRVE